MSALRGIWNAGYGCGRRRRDRTNVASSAGVIDLSMSMAASMLAPAPPWSRSTTSKSSRLSIPRTLVSRTIPPIPGSRTRPSRMSRTKVSFIPAASDACRMDKPDRLKAVRISSRSVELSLITPAPRARLLVLHPSGVEPFSAHDSPCAKGHGHGRRRALPGVTSSVCLAALASRALIRRKVRGSSGGGQLLQPQLVEIDQSLFDMVLGSEFWIDCP